MILDDYNKFMISHQWPVNGERWTDAQLDDLQRTLMRYVRMDMLYAAASDDIGSLQFDKVDLSANYRDVLTGSGGSGGKRKGPDLGA